MRIPITIALLLLACLYIAIWVIPQEADRPIAVTRQSGFVIEVDNDLMKAACLCHGIGSQDIRWDTINDNFVFIMKDGKTGYVFTEYFRQSKAFKEYLNSR